MPSRLPSIGLKFRVELSHAGLALALAYLTHINVKWLRINPKAPGLFRSGVVYQKEPRGEENFLSIPHVLRQGHGDCAMLAAWLAAELRVRHGVRARAIPTTRDGYLWHVVVRLPGGKIIDPSKILGMK